MIHSLLTRWDAAKRVPRRRRLAEKAQQTAGIRMEALEAKENIQVNDGDEIRSGQLAK